MDCYFCGKNFLTLNTFIFHLEYVHNVQNNYICSIIDCRRSFHKRYVYKNHIKTKHNLVRFEKDNNLSQTNEDFQKGTSVCFSIEKSFFKKTENLENIQDESTFDIQFEFEKFANILPKSVVELIGSINSNMSLNRLIVQEIIQNLIKFLSSGFINIIVNCVDHALKDADTYTIDVKSKIKTMILMLITVLDNFATDYKRLKYFSSHENLIQPDEHIIGITTDQCRKNNKISIKLKNCTAIYISIEKTLKSFLQIPNVFDEILQYQNKILPNDPLTTILQGELWKKIVSKYFNKIVIPLILYFDDFETCNPFGSHAGIYKLVAVYFTIASVPPKYVSRLENIFLAMLFHRS